MESRVLDYTVLCSKVLSSYWFAFVARLQAGAGGLDAEHGQDGHAQPDGVRRVAYNGHSSGLAARAGAAQTPRTQLPHVGHAIRSRKAVCVPSIWLSACLEPSQATVQVSSACICPCHVGARSLVGCSCQTIARKLSWVCSKRTSRRRLSSS